MQKAALGNDTASWDKGQDDVRTSEARVRARSTRSKELGYTVI